MTNLFLISLFLSFILFTNTQLVEDNRDSEETEKNILNETPEQSFEDLIKIEEEEKLRLEESNPKESLPIPTISDWQPWSGEPGTEVFISGDEFQEQGMGCKFGSKIVKAQLINQKSIKCIAPYYQVGQTQLSISNDHINWSPSVNFLFSDGLFEEGVFGKKLNDQPLPIPRVRDWSPTHGPQGTVLSVKGENFVNTPNLKCQFHDIIVRATFVDSTHLKCVAPSHALGNVYLEVSNNGLHFSQNQAIFLYDDSQGTVMVPKLRELQPSSASIGTLISFIGENFEADIGLSCMFHKSKVKAIYVTSTVAICEVPPHPLGIQPVHISNNGFIWSTDSIFFEFIESDKKFEVKVETIIPESISVGGTVSLIGEGFQPTDKLSCRFGNQIVRANFISPNSIQCIAPNRFPGPLFLEASNDAVHFSQSENIIYLKEGEITPSVFVLDPRSGPEGIQLSLYGQNFQNRPTLSCSFGGVFVSALWHTNTMISCIVPSGINSSLSVNIESSNDGVTFSSNKLSFQFVKQAPRIIEYAPKEGPGGTAVVVRGENFVSKTSSQVFCKFGTEQRPAVLYSSQQISCVSPMNLKGPVFLQIITPPYFSNEVIFTFIGSPIPIVKSISPLEGKVGTMIRLYGENFEFRNELSCMFNEELVDAQYLSPFLILCNLPHIRTQERKINVQVSNDGIVWSNSPTPFTIQASGNDEEGNLTQFEIGLYIFIVILVCIGFFMQFKK